NTIHDLGGMHGFGPIVPEADEPVFHADWEKRVFAIATAVPFAVPYNDDNLRPAIESIPPVRYLTATYYELWLEAVTKLLLARRVVSAEELADGKPRPLPKDVEVLPAVTPRDALAQLAAGFPARRGEGKPARFRVGDGVRARNLNPATHTRLPRYARGRLGVVVADHGIMSFNDANGRGDGEQPQHVYAVGFTLCELWGPRASPRDRLYLDLWDDHLDPA
ncbi:MAG: nitrile hydratase subunit beta, partial [Alphaproteobacteria bacterium]